MICDSFLSLFSSSQSSEGIKKQKVEETVTGNGSQTGEHCSIMLPSLNVIM